MAAFNLVTTKSSGTVLVGIWATLGTRPEEPQLIWMRPACEPGG